MMKQTSTRQPRFAQRKRIFPHRDEIFRHLDDGFPVVEIRAILKLEDIPLRTFEKNVVALREQRITQTEMRAVPAPAQRQSKETTKTQEDIGEKPDSSP